MRCDSCEVAMINGIRCHETGCPNAWKEMIRECRYCHEEFRPTFSSDVACLECKLEELEYDGMEG